MSFSLRFLGCLVGLMGTALAAGAQVPVTRVMPLGDSITYGSNVPGGYRKTLYQLLSNAGYNVDFVGTQDNNPVASLPDLDHEGHPGWTTRQTNEGIEGWLDAIADPDVVLLHIGTNDFGLNDDPAHAINRLDDLITKITTLRPLAHLIVTNLMVRDEPYNSAIQSQYNPFIQGLVNAHAAQGQRVTFLDMRSHVTLSEMPDHLHPGQEGYDHMAQAWLPAIQAVTGPQGDSVPPAINHATGNPDLLHGTITFSKPVADSAATPGNFSLSGGLSVSAATLDVTKRTVTLTTSLQTRGAIYTATVNHVVDRTPAALALPAGTTVHFPGATPRGYLNNVPEAAGYTLAYSLDIPNAANFAAAPVSYAIDNHHAIGPFTKVAYYLELQSPTSDLEYVWVSAGAFTTDAGKIGVPTFASGAVFQQPLSGMKVVSNLPGVTNGEGLAGNIEFWPDTYTAANGSAVPGASDSTFDFGDTRTVGGSYGSMQIHNTAAHQTVFGFNDWNSGSGANIDLGLGNNPGGSPDWTAAANAGGYTIKSLQVLVLTSGDVAAPTVSSATSAGQTRILVHFSEPVSPASVKPGAFSLSGGVVVLGATLAPNQQDVYLTTTLQPSGGALTLTVSQVRDSSPSANLIAPGTTVAVTPSVLPAEIVANIGAAADHYELVASINLPVYGNFNGSDAAYTVDNRDATGAFSRIAYYLELQKPSQPNQYVWTAMDAFTADRAKLVLPTIASGAVFQQNISNLEVISNVAGVVNGSTASGGNIEFWPNNYVEGNAAGVPNASSSTYDTGDTRLDDNPGWGSMQVNNHDPGADQTVFAVNHFGLDGQVLEIGIGNSPSGAPDWTNSANASSYTRRILHVLVLPGDPDKTGPVVASVTPSVTLNRLVISFDEPVSDSSADPANFNIPGLAVTGAGLLAGNRDIALTTSTQTAGAAYTVNVSGVRDRSASGNVVLAGTSAAFVAFTPPAVLSNIPETSGYQLVYKLAIPTVSPQWNVNAIPYAINEARYGEQLFDRVAYLLELDGKWVYASFDRHTDAVSKIGVPTFDVTGTPFQQNVANMNVASNVPGIVTGTGLSGGNIEFWGGNYVEGNAFGIANASDATLDFGDTMTGGTYGCMQVHNHDARQTLFAYNNWGTNPGLIANLGIGNCPIPGAAPDWTATNTATNYTIRNLYVLVRPGGVPAGPGPAILSQPLSRVVDPGGSATFVVSATGSVALSYQWRRNGVALNGQTLPWLVVDPVTAAVSGTYDVVVTAATLASTTSLPATLSVTSPYDVWARTYPSLQGSAALPAADPDRDGLSNLQEFAFGTDPGTAGSLPIAYTGEVVTARGVPVVGTPSVPAGSSSHRAVFGRRTDYLAAGLAYTVEFSTDLVTWTNSYAAPEILATDGTIDAVSVPFPDAIGTPNGDQPPVFFRIAVSEN